MTKDLVRRSLLSKRQEMNPKISAEKSKDICEKFYELLSPYESFLLYMPIKSEVDVLPLAIRLLEEGKRVYFPSVEGDNIRFKIFNGLKGLVPGKFGILEPTGEYLKTDFDVIAVPAVAFDDMCYRLGYGKGFYDRFLASCKPCVKVGLAYNFQIVSDVCCEPHDEPVDIIVTENEIIRRIG